MTYEATELLKKALTLSADERTELASYLFESLDLVEDPKAAEAAWDQEVARRIADVDSGKAQTIPWEDVRKSIFSKLMHGR